MVRFSPVLGLRTSLAAASAMAISVGPNSAVSAVRVGSVVEIFDAMFDSGDLTGPIDAGGGAVDGMGAS